MHARATMQPVSSDPEWAARLPIRVHTQTYDIRAVVIQKKKKIICRGLDAREIRVKIQMRRQMRRKISIL
ncbi:hypothetical protein RJ55_06300 [Drechmeria coniospora]|nr:hypothetical protein RJ55_06300 [Drechmeria coniospora]